MRIIVRFWSKGEGLASEKEKKKRCGLKGRMDFQIRITVNSPPRKTSIAAPEVLRHSRKNP